MFGYFYPKISEYKKYTQNTHKYLKIYEKEKTIIPEIYFPKGLSLYVS